MYAPAFAPVAWAKVSSNVMAKMRGYSSVKQTITAAHSTTDSTASARETVRMEPNI